MRLVVDAGLARHSRFDPACGMNRLVTKRISLAGAAQRRGRAGRLKAGICCRLWAREEEAAMPQQIKAEILESDLEELVLQLAHWGVSTVQAIQAMAWLDVPPTAALSVARRQLTILGALDDQGRITPRGRHMVALPTQPRLAHMLLCGKERNQGALACCLVALLEERDPLWKNGQHADSHLEHRLDWLCCKRSPEAEHLRAQAYRLARLLHLEEDIFAAASRQREALGQLTALAWPLWTAQRQRDQDGQAVYLLRQGKTALLPLTDSLAHTEYLSVSSLADTGAHGRIRLAAPLSLEVLEELFAPQISDIQRLDISADGQIYARRQECLDSLLLQESPLPRPEPATCAQAICDFLHQGGPTALAILPWNDVSRQWQARILLLRELEGDRWPDVTDAALLDRLNDWLAPVLTQSASLRTLSPEQLYNGLRTLLSPQQTHILDKAAPCRWQTPSGTWHPIIYGDAGGPWLAAKLQEFFGCEQGPIIANGRVAVTLHLNSPAGRPLQVTRDLGHFWRHGYASVRAEMRGRYPKHPWPEDPLNATATALTKKKFATEKMRLKN